MAEMAQQEGFAPKRSTPELVRQIATDASTLMRKEIELARQEIAEAMSAKAAGALSIGAAAVMGLCALLFLGAAAGLALSRVLQPWLAFVIVGGAFLAVAGIAGAAGLLGVSKPALKPEQTITTLKEDVAWARAQLKR